MILGKPARRLAVPAVSSPWIAGQINTSGSRLVAISPDGVQWDTAPTVATGLVGGMSAIYTAGGMIMASAGGVNPRVSFDSGLTWTVIAGSLSFQCDGLVESGGFWIAGISTTRRSSDGINWTQVLGVPNYEPRIFNGAIVGGANNGFFSRSTDNGATWTFNNAGGGGTMRYLASTASHIMMAAQNIVVGSVVRSATGISGSYSAKSVPLTAVARGFAASLAGDCLIISSTREMAYSNDSGDTWTSNGTIGDSGDTFPLSCNYATFGDGAWIIHTYNAGANVSKIWRATSVAGPFTKVGEFAGVQLASVRYIGP